MATPPVVPLSARGALGALDWRFLPSEQKGSGLVIAEAWLAGVPAVCTPVGIALEEPELVWTVPFRATGQKLAAVFLDEAANLEAVRRRAERARLRAAERYSAERFGREWTKLLGELR